MPIPATFDMCQQYLFADVDEMKNAGIPVSIQSRLIRLRDMYNYWLEFPNKKDMEIVTELMKRYSIGKSQAYDDIKILKFVLGHFAKTTKDYHRYRFIMMVEESFNVAKLTKDAKAMASAASTYAKYCQLDREDEKDKGYDQIIPQAFEPTDDPTVLGLKKIPDIRERIEKTIKKYWNDDIEEVALESAEYDEDKIFKPTKLKEEDEAVL
jgi:hypothetical protein